MIPAAVRNSPCAACVSTRSSCVWRSLRISSGAIAENVIQPIVDSTECEAVCSHLAMRSGSFGRGKSHQRLRTGEVIVKSFRLSLEEHVFLGIENEGWTGNLLGDPVAKMIVERRSDICSRTGCAGDKHSMRQRPCGCRRILHRGLQHPVNLRRFLCSDSLGHGRPLLGGNSRKVRRSIIVNAVIGDDRRDALFKSRRAKRKVSTKTYSHQRNFRGINSRQLHREVHHGRYDLLPVWTERETLAVNRAVLAGAIEGKDVVAALDAGARALAMKLLRRAVETGMHDEEWTLSIRLINAMEVAGQRRVLVGYFHG